MSDRALELHATADQQIAALIDVIGHADASAMGRPCPGRERLGDGTIGALAAHTAENYGRIAGFLAAGDRPPAGHGPGMHAHDDPSTPQNITPGGLIDRLTDARSRLELITRLTDQQLDAIPAKDSFRFCDGQRTLAQVLEGLLRHQGHQVQTLTAELTPGS